MQFVCLLQKGYQELEEELPSLQDTIGSQKPSKALVMQKCKQRRQIGTFSLPVRSLNYSTTQYKHDFAFVCLGIAIDYVHYLEDQKNKSSEELEALKKDYMGLQIMKQ